MATLCLDTSLEILRPICCRRMHPSGWDICRCLHKDLFMFSTLLWCFRQAISFKMCCPRFTVHGVKSGLPEGQSSVRKKVAPRPLLSRLGLVASSWVLLEDQFLNIDEFHVKGFHNSLWHILLIQSGTNFALFSQILRVVTLQWDTATHSQTEDVWWLPCNPRQPQSTSENKSCCIRNNQQMHLYAVNFIPLLSSLYMFRAAHTPIIRSTKFNCIYSHWYNHRLA